MLVTFAALAVAGWLLVRLLTPLRRRAGTAWRYGLANISRRGRESVVQIVAFGLGLMVLLLLALVRDDLLAEWKASLPADAPNYFMINIRPDEGAALESFLQQRGLPATELVPLIRARLTEINGVPVEDLEFETDRAKRFVEREANLTWSDTLGSDNELVAGEWWNKDDGGEPRVSVEREFAESLGLQLGDTVTHDVAGETVSARVSSLREVQWDSWSFLRVSSTASQVR
jgi:putative ABC transport system permease protein